MKYKLRIVGGLSFGLLMAFQGGASAAVSSGGQSLAPMLLEQTHQGGNIAPKFANRTCKIFAGGVDETLGDGSIQSRPTVFTSAIPDEATLTSYIAKAGKGKLTPVKNGNPDAGTTEYFAGPEAKKILFKRVSLFGAEKKTAAARELADFLDRNCQ